MMKKFTYMGKDYTAIKTARFKTSYGYAGSAGVMIKGANGINYGQYKNITEFKQERKDVMMREKRMAKK